MVGADLVCRLGTTFTIIIIVDCIHYHLSTTLTLLIAFALFLLISRQVLVVNPLHRVSTVDGVLCHNYNGLGRGILIMVVCTTIKVVLFARCLDYLDKKK